MVKLILIAVAVLVVFWLLRRALAAPRTSDAPPQAPGEPAGEQKGDLVSCAHCGVNLPKAEAYAASGVQPGAGGRYYCSEEHWRAGPRGG